MFSFFLCFSWSHVARNLRIEEISNTEEKDIFPIMHAGKSISKKKREYLSCNERDRESTPKNHDLPTLRIKVMLKTDLHLIHQISTKLHIEKICIDPTITCPFLG